MSPKLDARIKRSQTALLKAGMELLNNNKDATFSDIASHAGVGRATLYRLFNSREKLIRSIALFCLERFDQATDPIEQQATSAMDAIRLLFKLAMPLTQEFQFLSNLDQWAEEEPEVMAIYQRQEKELIELVEWAKDEGSISQLLPSTWVVNMIEGLFYAGWMQVETNNNTLDEVAEYAYRSLYQGVKP